MKRYTAILLAAFLVLIFAPTKVAYGLPLCSVYGSDWHIGSNCHIPLDSAQCDFLHGQQCLNCQSFAGDPAIIPIPTGWVCVDAAAAQPIPDEVKTEIGLLKAQPDELIKALTLVLVGLSGGISLFLTISGAAKYLLSSGNPEEVEEARGTIVHAVGGFLIVILSVFLLRFIGIDLLHIPGFSASPGGGVDVPYP